MGCFQLHVSNCAVMDDLLGNNVELSQLSANIDPVIMTLQNSRQTYSTESVQ